MKEGCCSALTAWQVVSVRYKMNFGQPSGQTKQDKMEAGIPWKSTHFMGTKQTLVWCTEEWLWSKFRWFQTSGPLERGILKTCGKTDCFKMQLGYFTTTYNSQGSGLSLNLSFHGVNCKCHPFLSKALKIKYIPVCILKIDVFFPVLTLNRWFHVATAEPFAAGLRPISELMSTKPKPEASGGNQATWPHCFQEHNCTVFSSIYVRLIEPAMHNNELQTVGQSLACTW